MGALVSVFPGPCDAADPLGDAGVTLTLTLWMAQAAICLFSPPKHSHRLMAWMQIGAPIAFLGAVISLPALTARKKAGPVVFAPHFGLCPAVISTE